MHYCERKIHERTIISMFSSYDPATGASVPYKSLTIASTLAWGLGYFGMPHILLRFMGIEDENKLEASRRIASGMGGHFHVCRHFYRYYRLLQCPKRVPSLSLFENSARSLRH